jgi:hypothetical protein
MKMKGFCLAAIFAFALQGHLISQDFDYKTWIYLKNRRSALRMDIEQLKDSSILISSFSSPGVKKYEEVSIERIKAIRWQKKGRPGRSMTIGAGIGFGLGFIVGIAISSDSEPSDYFYIHPVAVGFGLGIAGGLTGVIVGGIVNSINTSIPIRGSQTKYERQKEKLRELTRLGN